MSEADSAMVVELLTAYRGLNPNMRRLILRMTQEARRLADDVPEGPAMTVVARPAQPDSPIGIMCSRCGMVSWNGTDLEHVYCAHCHVYGHIVDA